MDAVLMFRIFTEIPSHPWALFAPNDWTIFSSFSLLKVISFSLFYVWYELYFRRALLLCRGWYCLLKKSLNKLAFSKKAVINLSLTRGDIFVIYMPLTKVLSNGLASLTDNMQNNFSLGDFIVFIKLLLINWNRSQLVWGFPLVIYCLNISFFLVSIFLILLLNHGGSLSLQRIFLLGI